MSYKTGPNLFGRERTRALAICKESHFGVLCMQILAVSMQTFRSQVKWCLHFIYSKVLLPLWLHIQ